MQVIITYSEYVFPFNENKKYSPGDNRSDGSIQRKRQGSGRTTWKMAHRTGACFARNEGHWLVSTVEENEMRSHEMKANFYLLQRKKLLGKHRPARK